MELFRNSDYNAIMSIPVTRRYRFIRKKDELERRRAARAKR